MNKEVFIYINSMANKNNFLDMVMISVSQYTPYIFIGLLFCLWFIGRQKEALYAGYATTLAVLINFVIGEFCFHPRPFMDNLGVALVSHKAENSFPSDHSSFVISIALMLCSFKSTRAFGVVSLILALWCGLARVYCGVHYPFDIVGSIAVSIIAVSFIKLFSVKLDVVNAFIIDLYNQIIKR